jgi:hypothetical protein
VHASAFAASICESQNSSFAPDRFASRLIESLTNFTKGTESPKEMYPKVSPLPLPAFGFSNLTNSGDGSDLGDFVAPTAFEVAGINKAAIATITAAFFLL